MIGLGWLAVSASSWLARSRSPLAPSVTTDLMGAPVGEAWAASPSAAERHEQAGPVDRRSSIRQSQRRCEAGLRGRRDHRQSHQRSCARAARNLHCVPRHRDHLQEPRRGRAAGWARARSPLSARRQVVIEGNWVRVNVQLVETKDGSQLWAERFDTERSGVLQVQDEIAGRVLRAIGLKVVDSKRGEAGAKGRIAPSSSTSSCAARRSSTGRRRRRR